MTTTFREVNMKRSDPRISPIWKDDFMINKNPRWAARREGIVWDHAAKVYKAQAHTFDPVTNNLYLIVVGTAPTRQEALSIYQQYLNKHRARISGDKNK